MNFGDAFNIIKKDKTIGMRLIEWESDIVVRVQFPNRLSYMTQPYLYQSTGYNLEMYLSFLQWVIYFVKIGK